MATATMATAMTTVSTAGSIFPDGMQVTITMTPICPTHMTGRFTGPAVNCRRLLRGLAALLRPRHIIPPAPYVPPEMPYTPLK